MGVPFSREPQLCLCAPIRFMAASSLPVPRYPSSQAESMVVVTMSHCLLTGSIDESPTIEVGAWRLRLRRRMCVQPQLLDLLGVVGMGEEPSFRRGLARGQRSDFQLPFLRHQPPGPKL